MMAQSRKFLCQVSCPEVTQRILRIATSLSMAQRGPITWLLGGNPNCPTQPLPFNTNDLLQGVRQKPGDRGQASRYRSGILGSWLFALRAGSFSSGYRCHAIPMPELTPKNAPYNFVTLCVQGSRQSMRPPQAAWIKASCGLLTGGQRSFSRFLLFRVFGWGFRVSKRPTSLRDFRGLNLGHFPAMLPTRGSTLR